jgi:hypothetical protein
LEEHVVATVIALVGLVIALLSAVHARRSATAAEASAKAAARSAGAAESSLELEASRRRDEWIERLAAALPDERQVARLVPTIPKPLAAEWQGLLGAALRRSPRIAALGAEGLIERVQEDLDNELAHDPGENDAAAAVVGWSERDVTQLNELYWAGKVPICPTCQADIEVVDSGERRPVPLMMAHCSGCGRSAQFPAATEQGVNFTEAEASRLLALHLRGSEASCPHDASRLTVEDVGGLGAARFLLRCPRCGASAEAEAAP